MPQLRRQFWRFQNPNRGDKIESKTGIVEVPQIEHYSLRNTTMKTLQSNDSIIIQPADKENATEEIDKLEYS